MFPCVHVSRTQSFDHPGVLVSRRQQSLVWFKACHAHDARQRTETSHKFCSADCGLLTLSIFVRSLARILMRESYDHSGVVLSHRLWFGSQVIDSEPETPSLEAIPTATSRNHREPSCQS
jgi:hypothetical protein